MKSSMRRIVCGAAFGLIAASALSVGARAGEEPKTPATRPAGAVKPADAAAAGADDSVMSPMRVQEFKATRYVYVEDKMNLMQMQERVGPLIVQVGAAIKAGKFLPNGPMLFVYEGINGDPATVFTLKVGFPVAPETKEPGEGLKATDLPAFRCATMVYSVPYSGIADAYRQLYNELGTQGLMPVMTTREYHLLMDGVESVNNVVLIQAGIK